MKQVFIVENILILRHIVVLALKIVIKKFDYNLNNSSSFLKMCTSFGHRSHAFKLKIIVEL
jgi:hypothetical protein